MARLFMPFFRAIDANGDPMSGAKLYFYITGTTTPKNTYSQSDLDPGHVNANPVVADGNGLFGLIYLEQDVNYKVILKSSADVSVQTIDPYFVSSGSPIAHQGSLIIGDANGLDSELLISGTDGAKLTSNGTTARWLAPTFTTQIFTSGSGTYTRPDHCVAIRVRFKGGGGGGAGGAAGPTTVAGSDGSTSTFNSIVAAGGKGGGGVTASIGGLGGTGGSGTTNVILRVPGCAGMFGSTNATPSGSGGGSGGGAGKASGAAGGAGVANSGGGGGGAFITDGGNSLGTPGGGEGESVELLIVTPSATYAYAVGAGGPGAVAANAGGAGGSGRILVEEYY